MQNPKLNRVIGYIILFIGFILYYKGFHTPTVADPVNGHSPVLIGLGSLFVIGSIVWMIKTVRCPYCGQLLHIKLYPINKCPNCGRKIE